MIRYENSELHCLFKSKEKEAVVNPFALKKAIGTKSDRFAGNQQEDAHEFLQELFSQLDADVASVNEKKSGLKNPVTDVFEWTLQNTVSCTDCSYKSVREDKCRDISVDFPQVEKENEG